MKKCGSMYMCYDEKIEHDDDVMMDYLANTVLWEKLMEHKGHRVEIVWYGDENDPDSVTLEDMDTNEIILDAGIYTLCAREDV